MVRNRPRAQDHDQKKRAPVTLVAERDGKVLLIRERRGRQFDPPGGGTEHGEYTMEAAPRELREETKLRPGRAERLFDYEGTTQFHKVARKLCVETGFHTGVFATVDCIEILVPEFRERLYAQR